MNIWRLVLAIPNLWWLLSIGVYLVGARLGSENIANLYSPLFLSYLIFFLVPNNAVLASLHFISKLKHQDETVLSVHKLFPPLQFWSAVGLAMLILLLISEPFFWAKVLLLVYVVGLWIYYDMSHRFTSGDGVFLIIPGFIGFLSQAQAFPSVTLVLGFLCWSLGTSFFLQSELPRGSEIQHKLLSSGVLWAVASLLFIIGSQLALVSVFSLVYVLICITRFLAFKDTDKEAWNTLLLYCNYAFGIGLYLLPFVQAFVSTSPINFSLL